MCQVWGAGPAFRRALVSGGLSGLSFLVPSWPPCAVGLQDLLSPSLTFAAVACRDSVSPCLPNPIFRRKRGLAIPFRKSWTLRPRVLQEGRLGSSVARCPSPFGSPTLGVLLPSDAPRCSGLLVPSSQVFRCPMRTVFRKRSIPRRPRQDPAGRGGKLPARQTLYAQPPPRHLRLGVMGGPAPSLPAPPLLGSCPIPEARYFEWHPLPPIAREYRAAVIGGEVVTGGDSAQWEAREGGTRGARARRAVRRRRGARVNNVSGSGERGSPGRLQVRPCVRVCGARAGGPRCCCAGRA